MSVLTMPNEVLGAIVVVDHDPISLAALTQLFRRTFSHPVRSFTSSVEALAWCVETVPDLIVTDFDMPGLNGLDLVSQVRQEAHLADVPVMVLTGGSDRETRYKALDVGANDLLAKPIDVPEALARTRNMLTLREAQRAMANRAQWLSREVAKATADLAAREQETIWRLSKAAEFRDNASGTHVVRIAHYARIVAQQLGLSDAEQEILFLSAPMHDVGKIGIPDYVLQKPGRLDDDEFALMQRHTAIGYDILKGSSSPLLCAAAEIALTHHERFDGTGYPQRLRGQAIPIRGRIVAVADVFDALTSERPYKTPWSFDVAFAAMRDWGGSHFDPACAAAFASARAEVRAVWARDSDGGRVGESLDDEIPVSL